MIAERMINHLIMQFSKSVNMQVFLTALGDELDELATALDDLQNKRWIDTGSGMQLDNIGVLIDRSRYIEGSIQLEFFGFFDQPNIQTFGIGRFRDTTSVAYTTSAVLDDEAYRPVLWHKVSKDTTDGTTESTIESLKFIFNSPLVIIEEKGNAKFDLGIGRELSDNDITLARAINLFIKAGGVGVDLKYQIPQKYFGFRGEPNAYGFEEGSFPDEILI